MDYSDAESVAAMREVATRICARADSCTDEAKTKARLIIPLFSVLGWDHSDEEQVEHEMATAAADDTDGHVDYAFMVGGTPVVLIEAKPRPANLALPKWHKQLFDYSSRTDACLSWLTRGEEIWFYSDLVKMNIMDADPYRKIDMCALTDDDVRFLLSWRREGFNPAAVREEALSYREQQIQQKRNERLRAEQGDRIGEWWQRMTNRPSNAFVEFVLRELGIDYVPEDISGYRELIVEEIEALSADDAAEAAKNVTEAEASHTGGMSLKAAAYQAMRESGGADIAFTAVSTRCRELAPPTDRQRRPDGSRDVYDKTLAAVLSRMGKDRLIERTAPRQFRATGLLEEGN